MNGLERILGRFLGRSRRSLDRDLEEALLTEEGRFYASAKSFWLSPEGRKIGNGQYLEGEPMVRVGRLMKAIQAENRARNGIPNALISPLGTAIIYSVQTKMGLAEVLASYGIINWAQPDGDEFVDWYSRFLPPDDKEVYEGFRLSSNVRSFDDFLLVSRSLNLATVEYLKAHPELIRKRSDS